MIELKDVCFAYDDLPILNNFNLTVKKGECINLSAPSGRGKTTVFRLICGLESPISGEITAPEKMAVVFQENRLIPELSLKRNVTLPLPKEYHKKAIELLVEIGLGDFLNTPVNRLSGGMKRRAAIVRAVAFCGDALLLDEPFNGIDSDMKIIVANIIKREVLNKNIPVIISTHIEEDALLLNAKTVHLK